MEILMKSGAVALTVVAITVIGVGSMIFNLSSNINSNNPMEDLESDDYITSTLEEEAREFNSQFATYEGTVKGTKVQELFDVLQSNALLNKEFDERLPDIFYEPNVNSQGLEIKSTAGDINDDDMRTAKTQIETTHSYYINFKKNSIGLIEQINIYYSRPIYGEY